MEWESDKQQKGWEKTIETNTSYGIAMICVLEVVDGGVGRLRRCRWVDEEVWE